MHIVLGVLAVLGAIAYFVIRANQVGQAGKELAETAGEVKGLFRSARWRSKSKTDPFAEIDDPRLAAAVMMHAIAKCDGDVTENQRVAMLDSMQTKLGLEKKTAEEMLVRARWLIQDLNDTSTTLRRAAPPVDRNCTPQEIDDLLDMLAGIANVEGEATGLQKNAIDGLKRRLRPDG